MHNKMYVFPDGCVVRIHNAAYALRSTHPCQETVRTLFGYAIGWRYNY